MTQKFRSKLELHSVINGAPARQILAAATDVCVKETLNGEYNVTFSYPRLPDDKDRYDGLIEDNYVQFPGDMTDKGLAGQRFVIKSVTEERRGLRVYKHVDAYHIGFTLGQYFLDDYVDFAANRPPEYLLGLIGNDTPFTFTVEGTFTPADVFEFGEKKKLELLGEATELYGAERAFDNYSITFTTRKGWNTGVELRYRKNLTGVTRTSHSMERITRLYGYGKNGLTIEGLPGHGVKYIDSQYFDPEKPYEGSVDFPEIEDQAALLAAMQKHLREYELPKVSYDIDFIEMEKVSVDFKAEAIREVGDTVTVIDESMGYRFETRVHSYERYPFEPKRARVILANFRELSRGDILFQATAAGKRAITYTSKNAVLKGVKYDDSVTLVDGFGMRVSDDQNRTMVRLGQTAPGEYGLALFNKAGVRTIWQDSATGNAYFSGTLQAANGSFSGSITATSGTIGGWSINPGSLSGSGQVLGGTIIGSNVIGTTITGGSVIGATVQTAASGDYVQLTSGYSRIRFVDQNVQGFEIAHQGSSILLWSGAGIPIHLGAAGNLVNVMGSLNHYGYTSFNAGVNFAPSAVVSGFGVERVAGLQGQLNTINARLAALEAG